MNVMKHIGLMVGMFLVCFLFIALITYVEDPLLDSMVSTGPNITLDEWRVAYHYWATFGASMSLLAAVVWYVVSQWGVPLISWRSAGKRRLWEGMSLLPLGVFVAAWLRTPPVQEGFFLATVFYFVNNLAVYYLATVWFSPSSFKYTPRGAATLRHW